MIKTAFISDTHGNWDILEHMLDTCVKDGVKLFIHSGDICPHFDDRPGTMLDRVGQQIWFRDTIIKYFSEHPDIDLVMIPGNHDFGFVKTPLYNSAFNWYWRFDGRDDWLPWEQVGFIPPEIFKYLTKNIHVLNCESKIVHGVKFFGMPYSKVFFNWAFNASDSVSKEMWNMVPSDTQVLISHGPPHMVGDSIPKRKENVGCEYLIDKLNTTLKDIKYVCCGHIHSGYGTHQYNNTTVINAALSNESNYIKNKPIVIEIEN